MTVLCTAMAILTDVCCLGDWVTGRSLGTNHHPESALEQCHFRMQLHYRVEKQEMLAKPCWKGSGRCATKSEWQKD